jgi:protoporphyrinogen IX oxidase
MSTGLLVNWVHIVANVLWIGSICAVAVVLLGPRTEGSPKAASDPAVRGALAHRLYLTLAAPAFVASFLFGISRLVLDASHYLKQPWMHIKLTLAVVVIALHHVIGGRAKKMANGEATSPGPAPVLALVLAVMAAAAAYAVYLGPLAR